MKNRRKELDVDFIGEQGHRLTKEEELAITAFIKAGMSKQAPAKRKASSTRSRPKQHA